MFLFRVISKVFLVIFIPNSVKAQTVTTNNSLLSEQIKLIRSLYPESTATDENLTQFLSDRTTKKLSNLESCASRSPYYSGLNIQYEPQISVTVGFTQNPNAELRKCTSDLSVKSFHTQFTLFQLDTYQVNIGNFLKDFVSEGAYITSIPENKVIIKTTFNNPYQLIAKLDENDVPRDVYNFKYVKNIDFSHTGAVKSSSTKLDNNSATDLNSLTEIYYDVEDDRCDKAYPNINNKISDNIIYPENRFQNSNEIQCPTGSVLTNTRICLAGD